MDLIIIKEMVYYWRYINIEKLWEIYYEILKGNIFNNLIKWFGYCKVGGDSNNIWRFFLVLLR